MSGQFSIDKIIIKPADIDLSFSPLKKQILENTFVLGAFNPGMTRLPNGNILLILRIAEALESPILGSKIRAIRWDLKKGYVLDAYDLEEVNTSDPRSFSFKKNYPNRVEALTSTSWLLPIELKPDGLEVEKIHYDKIIYPDKSYQEYGIEDARISFIEGKYYMTTCSVSSERQCTTLYTSENGLDYDLKGIILDHQNKDMVFFEGLIENKFYALSRPLGSLYFASPPDDVFASGPAIFLTESPDSIHWKPVEQSLIRPRKSGARTLKLGGGAQPILTPDGWLMLFHGVEQNESIGAYRTFWALLDKRNPTQILHLDLENPILIAEPDLTKELSKDIYIQNVVFTTGIVDFGDVYIVASGELDLCTRITHIPKSVFRIQ
jgi:predicted GH43/DUF377 family glycosyl hydrolase